LITTNATRNDVTKPSASKPTCDEDSGVNDINRSKLETPIIVGTANKNEYNTIVCLFNPNTSPPVIVAVDLDRPGITEID
jgi:hypothetical protein